MIDFRNYIVAEPKEPELIANIFPKNRLTLLHGQQGSGKTYSTIKCLNGVGITPLYIDLDGTTGISNLSLYRISQDYLLRLFEEDSESNIEGEVLIIDIYTRLVPIFEEKKWNDQEITKQLERLVTRFNITLIVIGHTQSYVNRDGLFHDNTTLARGAAEELFLEKKLVKGKAATKTTKATPSKIEYTLYINKGRGNGGARSIHQWMR